MMKNVRRSSRRPVGLWSEEVRQYVCDNSLASFALFVAAAGPVLRLLKQNDAV